MNNEVLVLIRYFAGMRELAGCDSESVTLAAATSDTDILAHIGTFHPNLAGFCRVSRVAVGDQFIRGAVTLKSGDEISIIPPVSGG